MVLGQLPQRKIAPLPPTPKLIITQTLTLTGWQFSSATSVWLPPNSKVNPALDPNPNPYEGDEGGGNLPPGDCSDTHGVSNK